MNNKAKIYQARLQHGKIAVIAPLWAIIPEGIKVNPLTFDNYCSACERITFRDDNGVCSRCGVKSQVSVLRMRNTKGSDNEQF